MLFDLSILSVLCALAIMLIGDGFRRHRWEGSLSRLLHTIFKRLDHISNEFAEHSRETRALAGKLGTMRSTLEAGLDQLQVAKTSTETRIQSLESKIEDLAARIYSLVPTQPELRAARPVLPDPAMEQDLRVTTDTDISLSPALLRDLLPRAIRKGHMEVFAQDIVRLPSRKSFALELEAYLRVEPGVYLSRHGYADVAADMGVLVDLDDYTLVRAIDHLEGMENEGGTCIVHVSIESLLYPGFLSTLKKAITRKPSVARQLIFEIAQGDLARLTPTLRDTMASLAGMGIRFSVGHIVNPKIDFAELRSVNATFLKLSASRVRALETHPGGYALITGFLERLKASSMTLIVDGVDERDNLYTLLEFHLPLACGKALGKRERLGLFNPKQPVRTARAA